MPWWGWIVVGGVLLAAEMFVIPTDFFLVFLGISAVIVGAIGFVGIDLPVWAQWGVFAVLSVVSLVFLRGTFKGKLRPASHVDDTLVGEIAIAREALAAGATGRIELRGTLWTARNAGDVALAPGDRARVEAVQGLMVHVRRET